MSVFLVFEKERMQTKYLSSVARICPPGQNCAPTATMVNSGLTRTIVPSLPRYFYLVWHLLGLPCATKNLMFNGYVRVRPFNFLTQ